MITMSEEEFMRCTKGYEDRGYWEGIKHGGVIGVVVASVLITPLVAFGVGSGIYLGVQQEVKK
jgi:hypothetical protein